MPVQEPDRVTTRTITDARRRARSASPLRLAPTSGPGGGRSIPAPHQDRHPAPVLEVRLHAPLPDAVIVRVAGAVDETGAVLVAQRVAQQVRRAVHVVLDLDDVTLLCPAGVAMLADLHRHALAHGGCLHIAGADHDAVAAPVRAAGLDHRLCLTRSADAAIALLPRR